MTSVERTRHRKPNQVRFGGRQPMPTIQVEANVTRTDLLRAAQQLPADELRAFVGDILGLQAQLNASRLPARESALLLQINQGLPTALEARCRELISKRRN